MHPESSPETAQTPIHWGFVARETGVLSQAGIAAYTQLYYHVTRFNREALLDLPMGEFLTKHAGNMGPSADIAIWGTLAGEVVKTIGESINHSKAKTIIKEIGDKIMPALTMAAIYWLNYLSESSVPYNPEGSLDFWSGMVIGGITIAAIKGIANRLRKPPHILYQESLAKASNTSPATAPRFPSQMA